MKQHFLLDEEGFYVRPIHANYNEENPMPDNVTDVFPPQPCWRPKWDREKKEWVETAPPPKFNAETEIARFDRKTAKWSVLPKPDPPKPPSQSETLPGQVAQLRVDVDALIVAQLEG